MKVNIDTDGYINILQMHEHIVPYMSFVTQEVYGNWM